MYVMVEDQLTLYDFVQPFGGKLDPQNRWIRLAQELDWREMEQKYAVNFGKAGAQALPMRMAFGSLVIRQALELSDRQTVMLITESPYLQYFIGLPMFTQQAPFSAHSMTGFRRRIPQDEVDQAVRRFKKLTAETRT